MRSSGARDDEPVSSNQKLIAELTGPAHVTEGPARLISCWGPSRSWTCRGAAIQRRDRRRRATGRPALPAAPPTDLALNDTVAVGAGRRARGGADSIGGPAMPSYQVAGGRPWFGASSRRARSPPTRACNDEAGVTRRR